MTDGVMNTDGAKWFSKPSAKAVKNLRWNWIQAARFIYVINPLLQLVLGS